MLKARLVVMPGETNQDSAQPPHVELVDDDPTERHDGEQSPGITNGKGWDGKLRVPGRASLANPEALSDPEYSDDDNVVQGQAIEADEGRYPNHHLQNNHHNEVLTRSVHSRPTD